MSRKDEGSTDTGREKKLGLFTKIEQQIMVKLPNIMIKSYLKLTKFPVVYYDYSMKQSSDFLKKNVIKISDRFRNCPSGNNKEETE